MSYIVKPYKNIPIKRKKKKKKKPNKNIFYQKKILKIYTQFLCVVDLGHQADSTIFINSIYAL